MNWTKLYELFDELPKSEQLQLFQAMQTTLFPESKEDIATMVGIFERLDSAKGAPACTAAVSPSNGTVSTALASDTLWGLRQVI